MDPLDPNMLVSTDWLAKSLSNPNLRILDGSWHLPTENRNALEEFAAEHIAGAQFFDIDVVSDRTSDLPHMVPPARQFEEQVAALGISNETNIVVYDSHGLFSAARVWWLFKYFGISNVSVLDGGLPKWKSDGHSTTDIPTQPVAAILSATEQSDQLRIASDVLKANQSSSAQIIDARPPARFKGDVPEPRAGLRSGHMPNAINVFYKMVLNEDGTLKSDEDLTQVFKNNGVDLNRPIITSCGSGITASVLSFALEKIGHTSNALYDGSWSEWGAQKDYPVEQG